LEKLIYILFFFIGTITYSQTVTQTYYDKCTGETKVYVIPMQGSTVVVYYNKSMIVSYNDVQSGAFQAWLEATYIWWSTYNPCSAAQATQTVVQQTFP
jgi:membrane-bound inhibitor of C-type lysozyme